VTPSGLATYIPTPGFAGSDSFTVTVTDNGMPPQLGTISIVVTVLAPLSTVRSKYIVSLT
jgi:hypothetical protein